MKAIYFIFIAIILSSSLVWASAQLQLTDEQKTTVSNFIHNNIDTLISEERYGEKWIISSIEFQPEGIVKVNYEDGHVSSSSIYMQIIKVRNGNVQYSIVNTE